MTFQRKVYKLKDAQNKMATEIKQIMDKLNHIQSDIDYLKGHISDIDLILTDDDFEALHDAEEDLAAGNTKRL